MSPCKNIKSYNNPLCRFSNGGTLNGKIPKIVVNPLHSAAQTNGIGLPGAVPRMGYTRFCTPILYPILYWIKTAEQYQYPIPILY